MSGLPGTGCQLPGCQLPGLPVAGVSCLLARWLAARWVWVGDWPPVDWLPVDWLPVDWLPGTGCQLPGCKLPGYQLPGCQLPGCQWVGCQVGETHMVVETTYQKCWPSKLEGSYHMRFFFRPRVLRQPLRWKRTWRLCGCGRCGRGGRRATIKDPCVMPPFSKNSSGWESCLAYGTTPAKLCI